jgi:hypothetical protein
MAYIVHGVKLIRQTKNMACWYASAQMVVEWRRNRMRMTEMSIRDPSEDVPSIALWMANNGVSDAQVTSLARALGLVPVPPMSPSQDAIEGWLKRYGPLWVNGRTHIVVIGGINGNRLYVYDPWPTVHPDPQWRPISWLAGSNADSLDPKATGLVFMHCPT